MSPEVYRPSEADRRPLASRSWRVSAVLLALAGAAGSERQRDLGGRHGGRRAGGRGVRADGTRGRTRPAWVAGAVLVQARLTANLLDGMVAIESGRASRLGELFNEVPDRVSDAATLIGLGHAVGGIPWLGDLAAVLALFVAYVRSAARNAGAPQDYSGPMAKQHRMFVVTVTALVSRGRARRAARCAVRTRRGLAGRGARADRRGVRRDRRAAPGARGPVPDAEDRRRPRGSTS